ncbi:iron-hydroxamate ABC transporter substrate-binding protein [Paenibacillus sp. GSMTC-2017]|uniref:iron-hydroxamate ABC transporter substrate-binding protein n=1 Tax=Paenibacillus sp. GSMTC-2017 TaxID=2794350 RepID=UPI0018D7E194|nr:iron-hydroxamate ABC transporter substrate-binding protein [Paenibacillus sp. GSMTC-2017]MBH5318288.1 iron-hydroxamate ABC transporter substrate-binding protein [Paenibacillus sp. GSMTC-2017]
MKKVLLPIVLILMLLVSACGGGNSNEGAKNTTQPSPSATTGTEDNKTGTITYKSESGDVVVPANPQRVVVLSSLAGNVMALGVNIVGVDVWSKKNTNYDKYIKDAAEVSEENLEKIIELNPDLILGLSTVKNIEKLKEIAPTVTFTYGKLNYLEQHVEIGKVLNKEKEAQAWVDDFQKRAQEAGVKIKEKIGADTTISVVESMQKQLYVFGDNWGRGTEILYQEMKLAMPAKVKEMALKDGYYAISPEVLPEYMGDYVIMSKYAESDMSFQETESYKNIPAVKNKQVFDVNGNQYFFNDPLTLDIQLAFFIEKLLGQ